MVFAGTGTHGAYHAGALRALQQAGVRIDVVAGHGVGAATAILAAVDGGSALWEPGSLWRGDLPGRFYAWRWPLRVFGWLVAIAALVVLIPVATAGVAATSYLVAFLLRVAGVPNAAGAAGWVNAVVARAFESQGLPTTIPRVLTLVGVLAVAAIGAEVWLAPRREGLGRMRLRGRLWSLLSAPLETEVIRRAVTRRLWDMIRGAGGSHLPDRDALGRRYLDVLSESLGQPGCRELLVAVTDLDARRDVVGALLAEPYRPSFLGVAHGPERAAEVIDLAQGEGGQVLDLLDAALTPGYGAEPRPLAYSREGYWRGETHRASDRPGVLLRLLRELRNADVRQAVIVSAAAPPSAPFELRTPLQDPRARLGEFLTAADGASCQEAVATAASWFDAIYLVAPRHNVLGAFDFNGRDDAASDRRWSLDDLLEQGAQDAQGLFIDPVVGDSGEHLARVTVS